MTDRPDIFELNLDPGGSLAITRSTNVFPPEDVTTVLNPADTLALLDFLTEHADTIRTSAARADHHDRVDRLAEVVHTLIDAGIACVSGYGCDFKGSWVHGTATKSVATELLGTTEFPTKGPVAGEVDGVGVNLYPLGGAW